MHPVDEVPATLADHADELSREAIDFLTAVVASVGAVPDVLPGCLAGQAACPSALMEGGHLPDLNTIDPIRFGHDDAIVERKLLPARDGVTVLAVDIIRPNTTEPVPTIFLSSPYYNTLGRGYKGERKTPWDETLATTPEPWAPFPEWYDEYFVPRGYAVVMLDMRGTRNSSGCQVYGGREEGTDAVDVIEWIARQPWSNGAVGMTGGSYDGTVAIAAAAVAPEALKAIIPIRAIDRWYDYHFFNGLQSAQHLLTPWLFTTVLPVADQQNSFGEDTLAGLHVIERKACAVSLGALVSAQYSSLYQDSRSDFWAERDFLKHAPSFKAATFIIHGLNDTNVKTTNAGHLWAALPDHLPKKLWWLRGAHDDPASPNLKFPLAERFVEYTHRWFAQFLKGIDTGVLNEPPVSVQAEDGMWHDGLVWPAPATDLRLYLTPAGLSRLPAPGTLEYADGNHGGAPLTVNLTSEPLDADLRLSGQAYLSLTYSLELGGDTTFAYRLEDVGPDGEATEIASAYARGAYRDDIAHRGASYPAVPRLHEPGRIYQIAFPFVHQDYVVPAGHRLRLRVSATDARVLGGGTGGKVTLHLDGASVLVVPVAAPRTEEELRARCAFGSVPDPACDRAGTAGLPDPGPAAGPGFAAGGTGAGHEGKGREARGPEPGQ